ncbi:hypothetical protein B0T13DRAFT_149172 [Neurospora crassa]|nr:hypothetical protein B0T13DRAFT_149172 [Neurospora crassa]
MRRTLQCSSLVTAAMGPELGMVTSDGSWTEKVTVMGTCDQSHDTTSERSSRWFLIKGALYPPNYRLGCGGWAVTLTNNHTAAAGEDHYFTSAACADAICWLSLALGSGLILINSTIPSAISRRAMSIELDILDARIALNKQSREVRSSCCQREYTSGSMPPLWPRCSVEWSLCPVCRGRDSRDTI